MTAKATKAFHAYDSENAQTVTFEVGDEVPDHIAATVGAHVVSGKPDVVTSETGENPFDGDAFDAAVETKVAEVLEERVAAAKTEAAAAETAQLDADGYGTFDPSGEGVKAKDVKDYLTALDRNTVAGSREFDRVTEAEKAGENRSSALVD